MKDPFKASGRTTGAGYGQPRPYTENELADAFAELFEMARALYPGGSMPKKPLFMVHSALSAFGLVEGGAATLTEALLRASAAIRGTIAMAAHSDAEESRAGDIPPPVAFDPKETRCARMGAVADYFRARDGTRRSDHPLLSFCASGPRARNLVRGHRAETGLGFGSPAGTLYREDAAALMLGTGWRACTVLHLAEYADAERTRQEGGIPDLVTCRAFTRSPIPLAGRWRLKTWEDIAYRTDIFERLGSAFERECPESVISGPLPRGTWRLVLIRPLVDFSIDRYPLFR